MKQGSLLTKAKRRMSSICNPSGQDFHLACFDRNCGRQKPCVIKEKNLKNKNIFYCPADNLASTAYKRLSAAEALTFC